MEGVKEARRPTRYEKRTYDPHIPLWKSWLSGIQSFTTCAIIGLSDPSWPLTMKATACSHDSYDALI